MLRRSSSQFDPKDALYPDFADSTLRSTIFAEQVIDRQRMPRAKTAKIGCSADQVYSQRRQCADNRRPSCSFASRFAGKKGKNNATGAFSRTRGPPGGA